MIKNFKKKLSNFIWKHFPHIIWNIKAKSQNNDLENKYLTYYAKKYTISRTFIEFGFSVSEYNCVDLTKINYKGLLIDANKNTCLLANRIFTKLNLSTRSIKHWIKCGSIEPISTFISNNDGKLGVLSIDIDGVDYWILKEIYSLVKPEIIIVEYNASLGIRPITIPYDENFDRHEYHKSGWYHGASIKAFENLLGNEYYLSDNIEGLNLIFIRKDKLIDTDYKNTACYKEHFIRNKLSNSSAAEQWEEIKDLPFIEV